MFALILTDFVEICHLYSTTKFYNLLYEFAKHHSDIKVTAIMADALYIVGGFMDEASSTYGGVQTISQLHKNKNIFFKSQKKCGEVFHCDE